MRLIVEELLMLARLDDGRPANPIRVDVGELARLAVGDARRSTPTGRSTSTSATPTSP